MSADQVPGQNHLRWRVARGLSPAFQSKSSHPLTQVVLTLCLPRQAMIVQSYDYRTDD
jgi:hypothetical protein